MGSCFMKPENAFDNSDENWLPNIQDSNSLRKDDREVYYQRKTTGNLSLR